MAFDPSRPSAAKDPFAANLDCIHCGLCLQKCPTYQELGSETDSPRGRIYLMKAARQGRIELDSSVISHLDGCLACRACESACPSGVRYESMLTSTRSEILRKNPGGVLHKLAFRGILNSPARTRMLASAMRLYQRTGLQRLVRSSGLLPRVSPAMARAEGMMPKLPPPWRARERYAAIGSPRARVGFLTGCVMPSLLPQVNRASIEALRHSGCEVTAPAGQACCGALHWHAGERRTALQLARRNLEAFDRAGIDALAVDSAGCGAAIKDYPHWFEGSGSLGRTARRLSALTRDVSELLEELDPPWSLGRLEARVAYDDPCHLLHGQRISDQPRRLLSRIPGLEVVEAPGSDRCCGAAGIYNLTQPEMSMRLLDRKLDEILQTCPDRVATGNPGCILHLQQGLHRKGIDIVVQHPTEILYESLCNVK